MIINAFDVGMLIWLWKNGTTGNARVTDVRKRAGGRSTGYYASYELLVGDQVYARMLAEIAAKCYRRLASGGETVIPVRYAVFDPTISYPWAQAASHDSAIVGVLLVAVLGLPVLFIPARNLMETIAVTCILVCIAGWVYGLCYACARPRKVFQILLLISQERPSKDLFRRIFNIALNTSE
jgi:hypothetical protein